MLCVEGVMVVCYLHTKQQGMWVHLSGLSPATNRFSAEKLSPMWKKSDLILTSLQRPVELYCDVIWI